MNNIAISLNRINKSFGENQVLNSIDFTVPEGTIMGLIGKNGAGKSTMIKCMLGLIKPDSGETKIFEENSWDLSVKTKHKIGYVPQTMTGFRWLKVKDFVSYIGSFYNLWNSEKVEQLLKEWEIDRYAKIGVLSEGERQKLSIILAMGHEPDLFILDEPVASLDPVARRKFIKQLIDLNIQENKTVLFSTHITSDLERVAADIALLKDGKISFKGNLSTLKERIFKIHIRAEKNLPEDLLVKNVINKKFEGNRAVITVDGLTKADLNDLKNKLTADIEIEYLNLEDIFLELNR